MTNGGVSSISHTLEYESYSRQIAACKPLQDSNEPRSVNDQKNQRLSKSNYSANNF